MSTIAAPRINTNDDKVQIVKWHVSEDDYVEAGADIVDLETSKAVVTITSELAGHIRPLAKERSIVKVGCPLYRCAPTIAELTTEDSAPPAIVSQSVEKALAPPAKATAPGRQGAFASTRFSQAARRLLKDRGWSVHDFRGAGLVTARSLQESSQRRPHEEATAPASVVPQSSAAPVVPAGPTTPRSTPAALSKQAEIQSLTIGESGNINSLLSVVFNSEDVRRKIRQFNVFNGNVQPIILFEIAKLLKKWPQLTAYFHDNAIHYYDRIDLGLAVDMGKGLKVVSIENADKLLPAQFYIKSVDIGLRYMRNELTLEEMTSSTVTVSDLSGMNMMYFHPLINGHQSAIIGIGGDSGQPGHPMTFNVTFDHRVSTGREVAQFLNELRKRVLRYGQVGDEMMVELAKQAQAESLAGVSN